MKLSPSLNSSNLESPKVMFLFGNQFAAELWYQDYRWPHMPTPIVVRPIWKYLLLASADYQRLHLPKLIKSLKTKARPTENWKPAHSPATTDSRADTPIRTAALEHVEKDLSN